jgi:hypothetical protein
MIILQCLERLGFNVHHVAVVLFVVDRQKMADQLGHVLGPRSQRRQVDRHHVEAIVKILAKPFGFDFAQ